LGVSSHLDGGAVIKVLGDQKAVAVLSRLTLALPPPSFVDDGFGGTGRTQRLELTLASALTRLRCAQINRRAVGRRKVTLQGRQMAKLRFLIPVYEKAMLRFIDQVVKGFFSADPLFGPMPWRSTEHAGPVRNVRGPSPLDQTMPVIEAESSVSIDTVRNTEIEDHTRFLYELATSSIRAFAPEFFKGLGEVTDAVGMSLDAEGKPFSFDMLNDMLEKLHIEFDEEGEPILPALVMHPMMAEQIRNMKPTPEQEKRHAEIIERKRAEYYAKKRTRRLS
jgi:hypothetical protein